MFRMILVFLLTLTGLLVLFQISPVGILTDLFRRSTERETVKSMHDAAAGVKRKHRLARWLYEMKDMLEITERGDQFERYCRISATLLLAGLVVGILLQNYLLAVILAVMGVLLPVFSVRRSTAAYTRQISEEYESTLMVINTSYMRTDNIEAAVSENIPYINPPIRQLFERFQANVKLGCSVENALSQLRDSVRNPIFREWCDAMIQCAGDHTMKHQLDPIVSKLTEAGTVQSEMDAKVAKPVSETVAVMIIVIGLTPILCFMNSNFFTALFTTIAGKIALSIVAAAELYALMRIIRIMRPLEEGAKK